MPPFALQLERPADDGRAPVLAVRGDLDLFTSPEFHARLVALAEAEAGDVAVDLTGSSFVDSGGCRALLRAARVLRARQARLFVVNRSPELARILSVMGLDEFLEIVESRSEIGPATRAVSPARR